MADPPVTHQLSESLGLPEVAKYWHQVVEMNEYSKDRFAKKVIRTLFSTITHKKIAILGFAFKKDTGDTRETAAISICKAFRNEQAHLSIYDPKVTREQIFLDLTEPGVQSDAELVEKQVHIAPSVEEACQDAEAVVIITEWDEFRSLNWARIYENVKKPAFLFDGRNITDPIALRKMGWVVHSVGKGPEIRDSVWA